MSAAVLLGGCSGREAAQTTSTTATTVPPVKVDLSVAAIEANGTPAPSDDVVAGVVATLDRYVRGAVIAPLQTGRADPALGELFTPAAAARLAAEDRETLVDEALPRLPRVKPRVAIVTLSTLADGDGLVGVVVARLDLQLRAENGRTALDVVRQGELVLVPDPAGWKIDSYQLRAARDTVPTTTTIKRRADR